jgi:hypothetical protein
MRDDFFITRTFALPTMRREILFEHIDGGTGIAHGFVIIHVHMGYSAALCPTRDPKSARFQAARIELADESCG